MSPTDPDFSATVDSALVIPSCEISPETQSFLQRLAERNGTSISQEAARILESSLHVGRSMGA